MESLVAKLSTSNFIVVLSFSKAALISVTVSCYPYPFPLSSSTKSNLQVHSPAHFLISSAMKRGRKSTRKKHTQENTSQQEEHGGAASMLDVPGPILMEIFSRLSVKSIFRCRRVCKHWLDLLLDLVFAKLHFSRAPTCPLLRDSGERRLSRALYLIELERDDVSYICDNVSDKFCTKTTMKLSTIFLLPERETTPKKYYHMERRFDIVNSCNGLLCLRGGHIDRYPIAIYNPVTGKYSVLPIPELDKGLYMIMFGLGFCPKTNRYKLLLIVSDLSYRLYTLGGLEGWRRSIGYTPYNMVHCQESCPVFINGAIHWLFANYETQKCVISFDFVSEEFRTIVLPTTSALEEPRPFYNMSLGVLRGHLYIVCNSLSGSYIDIWEMKDYGTVKECWFKEYHHFDTLSSDGRWRESLYQPADFLNNGELLMYHERSQALICIDKHVLKRRFIIGETVSKFQFVAHVPSFISLKDIMGDTLVVLNVRSSLARPRKKIGERISLVEEAFLPIT